MRDSGTVIAVVAAGDLEEGALARLHRLVVPGQMRRRGIGARGQQRHDRRIVAADTVDAARAGIIDLGDEIAFAHADLDLVDDALVHRLDDAGRLAHIVDLGRAFHRALPVDQRRRIDEAGVRQMLLQRGESGGREPVIVHLDADGQLAPTAIGEHLAER